MKKYYSILMAAVLVGLAACAKQEAQTDTPEDSPEIVAEDLIVFTATDGETKTKSEIDGSTGKFTWNTTDRIAVHTTAGYKLSATAVVDGEDAGLATFTVDKGGAAINGFALSPYTLVYDNTETVNPGSASQWGDDGGDLVVNLPGTYTLADIAGDKSPIPAIAVNEDGDLHFKQLGALLRVTLNNLPPSTRSVTIDFNNKKVQGAFTISSPTPGTSQIATSATDGSDDTITINTPDISDWTDGQVVNIPVPIGEYTTITVTSWDAADGADGDGNPTLTMTRYIKVVSGVASDWTPSRSGARKVIASLPAFSVSDDVRVHIAKSNLQLTRPDTKQTWAQYQALGKLTWSFMDYPWSHTTYTSVSENYVEETVIAHFKFGVTGYNYNAGIEDEEDYIYGKYYEPWSTAWGNGDDYGPKGAYSLTGAFKYGDWGIKACKIDNAVLDDGYGVSTAWRVPSGDEYLFLFGLTKSGYNDKPVDATAESDTRFTKRLHMWGMAFVETAEDVFEQCMIVFPDYFAYPIGGFVKGNLNGYITTCPNKLSAEDWALMEAAGAALYPLAGFRLQTTGILSQIAYHSNGGGWESASGGSTFRVTYGSTPEAYYINIDRELNRNAGPTVRLIRVIDPVIE